MEQLDESAAGCGSTEVRNLVGVRGSLVAQSIATDSLLLVLQAALDRIRSGKDNLDSDQIWDILSGHLAQLEHELDPWVDGY